MSHTSESADKIEALSGQFKCKVCSLSYKSLIQHLNKNRTCKHEYSVQEFDSLKEQSRMRTSLKNKLWKQENKDLRAEHNSTYYEKNRSVIAENSRIKYQIRKEEKEILMYQRAEERDKKKRVANKEVC